MNFTFFFLVCGLQAQKPSTDRKPNRNFGLVLVLNNFQTVRFVFKGIPVRFWVGKFLPRTVPTDANV